MWVNNKGAIVSLEIKMKKTKETFNIPGSQQQPAFDRELSERVKEYFRMEQVVQ